MNREQIEYELSRIIEIRDDVLFSKVVDFIIRHTEELRKENEELKNELKRERLRLAGCGVAALGYFDGCKDEYKSASLSDVLTLREKADRLRGLVDSVEKELIEFGDRNKQFVRDYKYLRSAEKAIDEALAKIAEFKEGK